MISLGVIYDDNQRIFLEDLLKDWQIHFEKSFYTCTPIDFPVAKGRINPLLHRRSLKSFLDQNEVVFFEWAGENLVIGSRLPHRARIIVRLHSWELFHHAKWVNWSAVDRIILVSQAMQRRFNEMYHGHEERTVVLPAGKSPTRFVPAPHTFTGNLAMLGNILPIKRVYEMVLVLAELGKRGYIFTLHLAGKPDDTFTNQRYYASLLNLIERLELKEHVIFHGWVKPADWLPAMDVFISNSYWEGQQNALIEAMMTGSFCLCHFWDGAEEILPEEYLFTTETSLVEKIINYAEMPENKKRLRQKHLRSIATEKFNLADSIHQYRALIELEGSKTFTR